MEYHGEVMGVLVRFGKQKAFLRGGIWISADSGLERQLNGVTKAWIQQTGGPPLHDRDHERTVAREVAGRLGGRILLRVAPPRKQSARVYISHRQMDLDFS
jgi:hypothetical protein